MAEGTSRYVLQKFSGLLLCLYFCLRIKHQSFLCFFFISNRSQYSCDLQESAVLILFISKTNIKTTMLDIQIYALLSWKQIQKNLQKYKDQVFFSFFYFLGSGSCLCPHTVHNHRMRYQTLKIHVCKEAGTFLHCN